MEAKQYVTKWPMDHWRKQKWKKKKKMPRDKWQLKHSNPKPTGHSKISSKREVQAYLQKSLNSQSNFIPKGTRIRTNEFRVSRRKEIMPDWKEMK